MKNKTNVTMVILVCLTHLMRPMCPHCNKNHLIGELFTHRHSYNDPRFEEIVTFCPRCEKEVEMKNPHQLSEKYNA